MMTILFDEAEARGEATGEIKGSVRTYNEIGVLPSDIIKRLMSRFSLKEEEARAYVESTLELDKTKVSE